MAAGWTRIAYQTLENAGTLTASWTGSYRQLKVLVGLSDAVNGNQLCFRFNDDAGQSYGQRTRTFSANQSSGEAAGTGTFINTTENSYNSDEAIEMSIVNPVGNYPKLVYGHMAGEGSVHTNEPTCKEFCGKWKGGDQIVKITCSLEFTVNIASGSTITVWGADDAPTTPVYPNLTNGTLFEESDTGKIYMWDGTNAWNEM